MSTYLISRTPTKYGTRQDDFIAQSEKIISKTADSIKSCVESKKDLIELFHEAMATMGQLRSEIANDHKSQYAHLFGVRRDLDYMGNCSVTILAKQYQEYNEPILRHIQKHLRSMKPSPRSFEIEGLKIELEKKLELASKIELSIYNDRNIDSWAIDIDETLYKKVCHLCSITPQKEPFQLGHFLAFTQDKDAMRTLKRVSLEDYKRIKFNQATALIVQFQAKPSHSDWVFATLRSQVNDQLFSFSQYITTITCDGRNNPVESMTGRSIVSILHQDPFLIDPMLQNMAKIFKEAIEWQGEDITVLTNKVALLQYYFAHAMPFIRGSAAIGEWLERSVYRYHGFEVSYNPRKSVNLEALTSPLSQFIQEYGSMFTLEKPSLKLGKADV